MKVRILTPLLLTGAVLTCPQNIFANQQEHNAGVQNLIEEIKADLNTLEKMIHLDAGDAGQVDPPLGTQEPSDIEQREPVADDNDKVDFSEIDRKQKDLAVVQEGAEEGKLSKVHELIKNYMDAQGSAARMVAEKVIRDAFKVDHKNTCFEIVKYIQDGGKGQNEKFGTLFSLMDMDARYATKGNKDILKGIREGVQMREKDARGVYIKGKIKFTPEMLCKK